MKRLAFLFLLFVTLICYINAEKESVMKDLPENNRMVGIDAIHDVKIDKDTIITRNMKPRKRSSAKKSLDNSKADKEPDWSYSSFPKEVRSHVEQFKLNMSECLKEVQASAGSAVRRLSPRTDSPVHGDCLIACVLKRNGVIQHGKVHKENLLTLVSKFYAKDTQLMKKLEKQLDRCVEQSARARGGECDAAARLNECTNHIMENNKHKIMVNY